MKIKSPVLALASLVAILLSSCQQEPTKEKEIVLNQKTTASYRAISGKDTAWLSCDTSAKIINGKLAFNYPDKKQRFEGDFKGEMYGDTLIGHWDFKINKSEKWNRNPVAFLKRDDKLIMGVGQFMLIMGSAHFDNLVPIDYEKGRFIFEKLPEQ